jgi:hypothetical protein
MEREDIIPLPRRARAASGQNAEELRAVAIYFRFRTELPTVGAAGKGGCRPFVHTIRSNRGGLEEVALLSGDRSEEAVEQRACVEWQASKAALVPKR